MKIFSCVALAVFLTGCATTSNGFDRDSAAWAQTIVGCQSAANVAGTQSDKAVWAHEKQELLAQRNGGWPSDRARLDRAVRMDTETLSNAGKAAASDELTRCHQIVSVYFPEGHPAA